MTSADLFDPLASLAAQPAHPTPHSAQHSPVNSDATTEIARLKRALAETEKAGAEIRAINVRLLEERTPGPFLATAIKIGELVEKKQVAYGDSFGKSGSIMRTLYPAGIPLEKLDDALTVIRIVDKLFRIATDRDALGESPWGDIAGYAILASTRLSRESK